MVKKGIKTKSRSPEEQKLAELLAAAEQAKVAYKWEQAIEIYSQALVLIEDSLSKATDQTSDDSRRRMVERFDLLDQRRICYRDSGNFPGEEAALKEMTALAEEMDDVSRQTRVTTAQAFLRWRQGQVNEARQLCESSLIQARQLNDQQLEADNLVNLALLTWRSIEQDASKGYVERALELHRELGDLSAVANDLRYLGMISYDSGETTQTQTYYDEALELFRRQGDRLGEGNTLNSMQIASPDLARRRDLCEQALAAFEATGNLERMAMMYNNIGFDYTFLGLYEWSLEYLQRSVDLAQKMQSLPQLAYALSSLGSAYIGMGDTQKARSFIEQSLSTAREIKDRTLEAGEWLELSRIHLAESRPNEALEAAQTAYQILQEFASLEKATALAWKGAAHLVLDEMEAAQDATNQAVKAFEEYGPPNENLPQEVWWWRYQYLSQAQLKEYGKRKRKERKIKISKEAWQALDRARQEMLTPIATLSDDGLRRNYFNKIKINRQIVQEWFKHAKNRKTPLEPLTNALTGLGDGQDQFRRLLDIGVRLNARGEVADLPMIILNEVVELSGAERATSYLVDEEGTPHVAVQHLPPYPLVGDVPEVRKLQILDEVMLKRVPRLLYVPEEAETLEQLSILCTPLVASGKLVGLFYCELSGIYGRFTTQDRDLLSMLANQAAVAMENANWTQILEQRVAERTAELTIINSVGEAMARQLDVETITRIVGEKVRDIFQAEAVGILFYDSQAGMILPGYGYDRGREPFLAPFPLGRGLASVVILSRQPLVLGTLQEMEERGAIIVPSVAGDEEQTQSYMGVPIIVGERVIGMVNVQSYRPHAFNEGSVRLLSTLSTNMGVAIENARLFQAESQRAAELAIINSVQAALAMELNIQGIYDTVGDKIREIFHNTDLNIRIYDPQRKLEQYPYCYEKGKRITIPPLSIGEKGFSPYVYRTRKMLVINENMAQAMEKYGSYDIPGTLHDLSSIYVPLIVGDQARGLINLANYEKENAFSESDVRLMQTLANSMSVALENARLFDETQRLLKETEQRKDELAILNSVGEAMARTLDVKTVTRIVGDKVRDIFDADVVGILLLEAQTNLIHSIYEYDKGEGGYLDYIEPLPLGTGLTSQVIASRQPLVLGTVEEQVAKGGYIAPESLEKGSGVITQSWLGVPIIVGERVLGVVVLSDYDPHAFNENHVRLLQTLSANMGVAIENARLFQAEQERVAELAIINSVQAALAAELNIQGIYDTVGDKIREIFHDTDLNIRIYDPKTNLESFPYLYENGERITLPPDPLPERGISAHVIRTHETVVINENMEKAIREYGSYTLPGTQLEKSAIYVPLIVGDQVRGLINLSNIEREDAFSESDVRLLQTLANSLSVALENARLFEETQRLLKESVQRASELAIINRVGMALARQLDSEAIVSLVGEKLGEVFPGQMCSIALYEKATNLVHWPYFVSFDGQQIPQESVTLGPGLTSHVIHTRQPLVLGTLKEAEAYGAVWVCDDPKHEPQSWIGVPILVADEAIGVLAIQDMPEHRYSENDVHLLGTLSSSMGVALENARLFAETKRLLAESEQRTTELTTINTVSQALSSELELDSLIQLIGEQMRQVFQADIVYVGLHDLQTNLIHFPYVYGDELSPISYGEGLTSKILETGKPLLINQSVEERATELGASRVGVESRSYLGVPILAGKKPIGVISVQSVLQEGRFGESDVHLLSTIAANVGAAIQNARLYKETQRRAVEMAALAEIGSDIASTHEIEPVLERLAARTKELLNVGDIALYLIQPDGDTMRAMVALGKYTEEIKSSVLHLGEGISGSIAQSGIAEYVNYPEHDPRVIQIPGTPGAEEEPEGFMSAPMISRGNIIGLMSVWRGRNLGLFTQSELDFLVSLTRQAAIAIESARLYLETQRRADQMATIAEVGRELSATLDLQTVLENVASQVHRLFNARDTILRLVEPDGKSLRSVVALGVYSDEFKSDLVPLGEGITGSIAQSGMAEVIDDVSRDPRGIHVGGTPEIEEEPETLMVAPLMAGDRTIGSLSVYRNRQEGLFTPVDLDFLVGLGRQAAIAIENARLFAEVQSQKQFSESLVQNIPVAIVTTDMDINVDSWNPAAERLFGYTQTEALGRNLDDLVVRNEILRTEAAPFVQQAFDSTLHAITRRTRKNGDLVDVELSGVSLKRDGDPTGIIAIYHDISEIKRAEAAIQESERRLADIINFLPDATLVIDREGRVIAWNRAMEGLTEIKAEDMLGKGDYEYALPFYGERRPILVNLVFRPQEELESKYVQIQRHGDTLVGETHVTHLRGGERYLMGTASVLHDSKGQVAGAIEIVRDITDRKTMEDELRKAKVDAESANQAKSAFLAMMSHEIRTPMNAIIGMSGLLMDTPLDSEQHDFAETIRNSGDALLTIINDILDFSKIEAGKMELEEQPFDLRECLESSLDLVKMRASEKGLELAYQVEQDVPVAIVGDVTRLRQILINLLNNAVKFTENGEVVLSVENVPSRTERGIKGDGASKLQFSVRDTGIGILKDLQDRLFRAFSQADATTSRRYGGTGLGLAISKRLSEMMGGEMWVESQGLPGKGSTFYFTIVTRAAAEMKSRPHLSREQPELSGKRLLIVDDNATNCRILSLQTKTWGMIARDTTSPSEALNWLQRGDPFDLAILDMQMPGKDGLELAKEIREICDEKALPMVLTSSLGKQETHAPEGLFVAYMSKPIRPSVLFDTLMNLFATAPRKAEESTLVQPRLDPEMASHHPLRILLAEDNVVNQKLALRLLSQMGYRADVAANGVEAIRSLERQPYDVILMDVQMPEMDGLEASRRICSRWPRDSRPHIIAMTANAMQGDREICLEAGMDDYVSKPIRVDELVRALYETHPMKDNK